jgi:DNA repair exonuclease SbcCD nuclease subunit
MVRIAHISDSHLGCSMFQLTERREDARRCFEKAVDMAMKKSPDILVHTGDLFHESLPQNDDLNFVIKLFKKLKGKVDLFVLQGNHDHPFGYRYNHSPLIGLETMGLIVSTGEKAYRGFQKTYDGEEVEIHLLSWASEKYLDQVFHKVQPKEDIALFFAHDIPFQHDELPVSFDYYGCGHKHTFNLDKENNVGRPGSTCYVRWETEHKGTKKLIVIDADSSGCEYEVQTLNDVREFKFVPPVNISKMGPEEADKAIKDGLDNLSPKEKSIIIVQVNGIIEPETERKMERSKVLQYGEKKHNPLFLHVSANWQCSAPEDVEFSQPLDVESSVTEYMESTKDVMKDRVIRMMNQIFGGDK